MSPQNNLSFNLLINFFLDMMGLVFSCLMVSCCQKLKAHNFENMQLMVLSLINLEISK